MKKILARFIAAIMIVASITIGVPAQETYAAVATSASSEATQTVTMYITKTCYSYKSASTKSEKVKKLYKGAAIKVVSETKSYYKLSDNSYVLKSKVGEKRINWTTSKYKTPIIRYVSKDNTKARESALGNGKVVDTLEKGTKLTIIGKTNSGFFMMDDGGYVKQSSVTKTKPKTEDTIQSETNVSNFEYKISNGKATIEKYTGSDAVVVIPSEIEGCPVTVIGSFAFAYCHNLTSVTIGTSVTTIDQSAFYNCSNLISVTIPDSVTRIEGDVRGTFVFEYCTSLSDVTYKGKTYSYNNISELYNEINTPNGYTVHNGVLTDFSTNINGKFTIPDTVTEIGERAFVHSNLTSVTIHDNVTKIGGYSFVNSEKLTSIIIPDSVKTIGDGAFIGCTSLSSITIPADVTKIGNLTFRSCSSLTTVKIPDGVTFVGEGAFKGCAKLTSVTIPDSVIKIENDAFADCTNLSSVTYKGKTYSHKNIGLLYDAINLPDSYIIENGVFIECANSYNGKLIIPDSVTEIGEGAFSRCYGITSITIPDSVTKISDGAFSACTGLKSINIPNSVTHIGDLAFGSCYSLASITIPNSVTNIGNSAFSNCTSLTSVNLPDSITTISESMLSGCGSLTAVNIPKTVTTIEANAFQNCNLSAITIPDSVNKIGSFAFIGCPITSVTIPKGVTIISEGTFYLCDSLTSITIPDSVTQIGDHAFWYCSSLTSVNIPDSVNKIGNSTFGNCTNLNKATYKGKTYSYKNIDELYAVVCEDGYYIDNGVLTSCVKSYKGKLVIPDSVTTISAEAFYECTGLTHVIMADSITEIGDHAFYGCDSLKSVTISEGVSDINWNTFACCTSLTSVTIPDSVTYIGNGAFYGCKSLTTMTIPDSVNKISNNAFANCTSLTKVTYKGKTYSYKSIDKLYAAING